MVRPVDRVGSGRVQKFRKISGSGRVGSRFYRVGSGRVPKFGPACNSDLTVAIYNIKFNCPPTDVTAGGIKVRLEGPVPLDAP